MLTAYKPEEEAELILTEDEDGNEFPCHDLNDALLWEFAAGVDELVIRIVDAKTPEPAVEIKRLCQAIQSMVYARAQVPTTRHNIRLPQPQELGALRDIVRQRLNRRMLAGVSMNAAGDKRVLALCFVPAHVHGCRLTVVI